MSESHVDQLVRKLREADAGTTINLVEWLNFTTFDTAADLCFGESFDCLKSGKAHPGVEISYDFGKGLAFDCSRQLLSTMGQIAPAHHSPAHHAENGRPHSHEPCQGDEAFINRQRPCRLHHSHLEVE